MISVEDALDHVSRQTVNRRSSKRKVEEATGCILATDIKAPIHIPIFDNSAMDGYALGSAGRSFTLVGEVAAGVNPEEVLKPGEAVRIFTGAKVPEGTYAVVMQEKVVAKEGEITLEEDVVEGANVRKAGEEIHEGDVVFQQGHLLNAATAGLLYTLGITAVEVYKPPRVGLMVTGNELVTPGEPLGAGQIYESNGGMLKVALEMAGVTNIQVRQVKDDLETTRATVAELLHTVDILLVSGGISVGDYDFVKQSLEANGVEEVFYKVKQKPGKPLYFGKHESSYVFALPGNPASSLNCFYVYVRPLIENYLGVKSSRQFEEAVLSHAHEVKGDRPVFYRSKLAKGQIEILGKQSSSMLHSFALGNALVYLQPGSYPKGASVPYIAY
ncbi:molybdopterin molybdotransferase MoeA [Marinoscillum furvescens]|uniref:Molybdopterin molybdenumtransferase n=1 Tax=Marinoscillum furvescens DSM 4134 TaxID=1122208 RepID=A0A3D9LG12_MARFU|nr:gephyrin-like molybdotransferase Glp [Marinoscillum furvescens]REE05610.1 molybdopterin molybdochelatase [Marinoscillum furvescens DSM 4134]